MRLAKHFIKAIAAEAKRPVNRSQCQSDMVSTVVENLLRTSEEYSYARLMSAAA